MRKSGCVLLALCLLLGLGGVNRADDDARAIIDKAIKAAGGEQALAKYKAQTWKEKGTFYGEGDGQPYTGTYAVQWPDKFKMEITDVFTLVLKGDQGWFSAGGNTTEMSKEQLAETKEGQYIGWVATLLPLTDKAFELSPLGESKVGDQEAVAVKVARKDHNDVKLYFNKETGLLVKFAGRFKEARSGKEVDQESTLSDYKEVAGIMLPTKVSIKRNGKLFVEAQIDDLKPMDKLGDDVFAKP